MEKAIKIAYENSYRHDGIELYNGIPEILTSQEVILLDPLFWQALEKGLGQEDKCEDCIEEPIHKWCASGSHEEKSHRRVWKYQWHRFIDHLAEGKDIESFFTNLIK